MRLTTGASFGWSTPLWTPTVVLLLPLSSPSRKKKTSTHPVRAASSAVTDACRSFVDPCEDRRDTWPAMIPRCNAGGHSAYGEITYGAVDQLFAAIEPEPGFVFYDLGSGLGKMVFQVRPLRWEGHQHAQLERFCGSPDHRRPLGMAWLGRRPQRRRRACDPAPQRSCEGAGGNQSRAVGRGTERA